MNLSSFFPLSIVLHDSTFTSLIHSRLNIASRFTFQAFFNTFHSPLLWVVCFIFINFLVIASSMVFLVFSTFLPLFCLHFSLFSRLYSIGFLLMNYVFFFLNSLTTFCFCHSLTLLSLSLLLFPLFLFTYSSFFSSIGLFYI